MRMKLSISFKIIIKYFIKIDLSIHSYYSLYNHRLVQQLNIKIMSTKLFNHRIFIYLFLFKITV